MKFLSCNGPSTNTPSKMLGAAINICLRRIPLALSVLMGSYVFDLSLTTTVRSFQRWCSPFWKIYVLYAYCWVSFGSKFA